MLPRCTTRLHALLPLFHHAAFSSATRVCLSQPPSEPKDKWNYNEVSFLESSVADHSHYPLVTANQLEQNRTPPRRVRMLVRDFIEDSLYNPHYGYFPNQATILDSRETAFDFPSLRDSVEFQEEVAKRYAAYGLDQHSGPGRQLWHTPSELFKPWYGQSVARCIVSEYLLKYFPYEDLKIYEIGAGNGTLALNILDYIREEHPDVYDRTQYTSIEISNNLAEAQKKRLCQEHPCFKVVNESIFHWKSREPAPCFFIAMEVVDNFGHDLIRYDYGSLQPYQGLVAIDDRGDFFTTYTRVTDPLILSFVQLRQQLRHPLPILKVLQTSSVVRRFYTHLPFAPNLSTAEYIPTRLLNLLQTLRMHFPRHRLLLSDFSSLPDTIPGVNAPVVQTRFRNTTVPCSTLLVKQGYFDIFFPTNFGRLRDMYEYLLSQPSPPPLQSLESDASSQPRISPLMTSASSLSLGSAFFSSHQPQNRRHPLDGVASASGLPIGERKSSVFTHAEFLQTYSDLTKTRLRNGENPMLDFYKNVKFLF